MDKYYMLVRRFVNASFRLLIAENWSPMAVDKYNTILTGKGGPLEYVVDLCVRGTCP